MGSNKRIFKNTLFLYFRMLLILVVSLYTSRIVLQLLGVVDYGINNVVGGLVTTMTFLTGAISSGTSRFYAYNIGKQDSHELNISYKLSVFPHSCRNRACCLRDIGFVVFKYILADRRRQDACCQLGISMHCDNIHSPDVCYTTSIDDNSIRRYVCLCLCGHC